MSKPLTFVELAIGDLFISFPLDGDDAGHGGYRNGSFLFKKSSDATADRLESNTISSCPPGMAVLKVIA